MMAVMDKRVNGLIGDAAIDTIQMRTSEPLGGIYLLGAALTQGILTLRSLIQSDRWQRCLKKGIAPQKLHRSRLYSCLILYISRRFRANLHYLRFAPIIDVLTMIPTHGVQWSEWLGLLAAHFLWYQPRFTCREDEQFKGIIIVPSIFLYFHSFD